MPYEKWNKDLRMLPDEFPVHLLKIIPMPFLVTRSVSRTKEGNQEAVVRDILEYLGGIENEAVRRLAGEISEVLRN